MTEATHLESLLAARARHLATPATPPRPLADTAALLAFDIGRERYLLPAAAVAEVLPVPRRSPLPGAPAWAEGIVAARGQMLILARLDRLLSGGSSPADDFVGPGVCIALADTSVALLADGIVGTLARPDDAPAELGAGWSAGVRQIAAGMWADRILIDVTRLIEQLSSHQPQTADSATSIEQGDHSHAPHR